MAAQVSSFPSGMINTHKPLIPFTDVMTQLMEQETSRWRTVSANPSLAASNSGASTESTNSSDTVSELFLIK